ncbi:MAG TPA: hypothetical protein VK201_03560 [bacterium]|nr:hypothetical protein [bacterium]
MDEMFKTFGSLLEQRLRFGTCSGEESLRYTFFAAAIEQGLKQERIVLECPPCCARIR